MLRYSTLILVVSQNNPRIDSQKTLTVSSLHSRTKSNSQSREFRYSGNRITRFSRVAGPWGKPWFLGDTWRTCFTGLLKRGNGGVQFHRAAKQPILFLLYAFHFTVLLTVKHRERHANLPAIIASRWVTQQYKSMVNAHAPLLSGLANLWNTVMMKQIFLLYIYS